MSSGRDATIYNGGMWSDSRFLKLVGVELPIVGAPMAGPGHWELAAAVTEAGGLGSLSCAMLSAAQVREEMGKIRERTNGPVNLNFFCHVLPAADAAKEAGWRKVLDRYYREM